jgi:hypothetical protein
MQRETLHRRAKRGAGKAQKTRQRKIRPKKKKKSQGFGGP